MWIHENVYPLSRQTQFFILIRFLATEHGLAGRTSLEAAQADEIVDAITDMVNVRVGAVFEPDEAKKAEKMQAYLSQTLPTGLVRIFFYNCNKLRKPGTYGEVAGWEG